jgi:oxygen-independent coproporphyrinogen-3 oxidase
MTITSDMTTTCDIIATSDMATTDETIIIKEKKKKSIGLYFHIPFCVKKCRYCDFCSYPVTDPDIHLSYILKIIYELRAKRPQIAGFSESAGDVPNVDTIYIGGGTPSVIEAGFISELLDAVYASYIVAEDAEITIEVNPGTAGPDKFLRYKAAGINRVSIGAQSFDAETLTFLGRIHDAKETVRCVLDARRAGFDNIGLDLIFGIPGQNLSVFEKDLEAAMMLGPQHVSYYSLQIEEKTPIHDDYIKGIFDEADEIEDRRMYHLASDMLSDYGLYHYEISNSAKPGKESRHNLKYWSMEPYAGFGVSAHSYIGGKRFSNTSELAAYLTAENSCEMTEWTHENTLSDDMSEFIFLGLRRTAGIELSDFRSRFGKDFWELYGEETEKLIGRGLLEQKGGALRLTSLGLDVANTVFSEYV